MTIRAGSARLESGGDVHQVANIINHEEFNRMTYDFDFALLQLSKKIDVDGVTKAVIPLPEADTPISENTPFLVTGWGYTLSIFESRDKLRGVIVTTDNQEQCDQKYAYDGGITGQMVCASEPGKDSCSVRMPLNPL